MKRYARRKTARRIPRRRVSRRIARRGRRTLNVNRALQPIAQRTIVKMKYSEIYAPTASAGQAVWRLNLNSIFDPNRTGVGHQPYGRDTFATLYNRYRVISCHYVASAYSLTQTAIQLAALPANEEFVAATVSEYRENPRCKYALWTPGSGAKMLKGTVNIPSLVGRNKAQYMADDRYQSDMGSSPAELAVLNLSAENLQESITDPSVIWNVTLVYTVECFDAKNLSQS